MNKPKFETPDMTQKNIDKISQMFPNCITETKDENGKLKKAVNFELLQQMLSEEIADKDEAYEFTWVGKNAAIVEANIGTGHMREICRQLARLDLKEKARPAEECFGELICEAAENMTCFISCNAYPEFTQMLKQYQSAGNEFVWYYLIRYGDLVEIDEQLMPHVKIIKI